MKAILGCFRTISTVVPEFETSLPPPHLHLQSKILRSYIRLQTLRGKHPIQPYLGQARVSRNPTHVSPLEYFFRSFPQYATTPMEIIHPFASHHSGLPYIRLTLPSIRKKRNGSMTKRSMKLTQSAFTRTGLVSMGMLVQPPTVIKPQSGKRNIFGTDSSYSIRHVKSIIIKSEPLSKDRKFSLWQGYFGNLEYFSNVDVREVLPLSRVGGMLSIVEEDGEICGGLF